MISKDKLNHMMGVARKCYAISNQFTTDENERMNYFLMGFLHDVGYENGKAKGHAKRGYDDMLNFGCADNSYLQAIKNHGTYLPENKVTPEYLALVYSDLTVDHLGNDVTVEERLNSIKERYGLLSEQYQNALLQAKLLKKRGLIK